MVFVMVMVTVTPRVGPTPWTGYRNRTIECLKTQSSSRECLYSLSYD
jgi:hypothetical protein